MKIVAVYGSLKKNKYNHSMLSESVMLDTSTIVGDLFSMGSYPALVKNEKGTKHDVELYHVSDSEYKSIFDMEIGAGYYEEEVSFPVKDDAVIKARIYYADVRLKEHCKKHRPIISSY